jgi:hypothetical protein
MAPAAQGAGTDLAAASRAAPPANRRARLRLYLVVAILLALAMLLLL